MATGAGRIGTRWSGTTAQRQALAAIEGLALHDLYHETDTGDTYVCENTAGLWVPVTIAAQPQWTNTLENLQVLTTNDGVAVGMRAWDTTCRRWVVCTAASGSSSTWLGPDHIVQSQMTIATASLQYIAFNSIVESSTVTDMQCQLLAPFPGYVRKIEAVTQINIGVTVMGVHLYNATPAETDSEDMAVDGTLYTFNFTTATAFLRGQRLAFSFDSSSASSANVIMQIYLQQTGA